MNILVSFNNPDEVAKNLEKHIAKKTMPVDAVFTTIDFITKHAKKMSKMKLNKAGNYLILCDQIN
jgi:hypothetical protein